MKNLVNRLNNIYAESIVNKSRPDKFSERK